MGLGETLKSIGIGGSLLPYTSPLFAIIRGIRGDDHNREDDDTVRAAQGQASSGRPLASYKRGGVVRKTGPALLHEGERAGSERVPHTGIFNVRKGTRVVPNRSNGRTRGR